MNGFYEISFEMSSPICFIDRPIFDALIVYCWMKEKYGDIRRDLKLSGRQLSSFPGLPIEYHPHGYPISSIMLFNKSRYAEYIKRIKKRWCSKHDYLADFGKSKRHVNIGKGHFKSFDIPLSQYDIKDVWFYFKGNAEEVKYLINRHLAGIGKKTSIGNGFFKSYRIKESDEQLFEDVLLRPIPREFACSERYIDTNPYEIRYCGFRPSYYNSENQAKCIYPIL